MTKLRSAIAIIILATLLCGCSRRPASNANTAKSPSRELMGTFARAISVAKDIKTAESSNRAAFEQLRRIDEMMSDFIGDSELSKVNRHAFDNPVKVGEELFEVLTKALEYSKLSSGAFDITIGPIVDLWKKAEQTKVRPTEKHLADAKQKVGFEKLILSAENKTVKFAVEGMRLDLGAIAKGYAIDKAIEAMIRTGATGGMIDVGGDIRCFGKPENKDKWTIGLQDPDTDGKLMMIIELADNAIATSGDYRRFVMLDGEKFSHIMAPKKGSSTRGLASVTIIAKTAIDTDALATTVTVMGMEKGIELIETIGQTEALIIPSDPALETKSTEGFQSYIRK